MLEGLFCPKNVFIPASNEPSAVIARAFGKCREGQNTNVPKGHIQLCCASSLIPRQLAAGYLILDGLEKEGRKIPLPSPVRNQHAGK